jgi:hypothetical protein
MLRINQLAGFGAQRATFGGLNFNDGTWTLSDASSSNGRHLTDASAAAQGYALKAFPTTSGTGYELSFYIVQDAVAPATRHPLMVLDLATDGQAWLATDSAAMTIQQGGSMGGWGVEDLGTLLRYWFRFQATASTTAVQIAPAYGQSALGGVGATGTVTFDDITVEALTETGSNDFSTWTKFNSCGWTKNTVKDNNAADFAGAVKSFAVTNGVGPALTQSLTICGSVRIRALLAAPRAIRARALRTWAQAGGFGADSPAPAAAFQLLSTHP